LPARESSVSWLIAKAAQGEVKNEAELKGLPMQGRSSPWLNAEANLGDVTAGNTLVVVSVLLWRYRVLRLGLPLWPWLMLFCG
jgi:hypothetical protein